MAKKNYKKQKEAKKKSRISSNNKKIYEEKKKEAIAEQEINENKSNGENDLNKAENKQEDSAGESNNNDNGDKGGYISGSEDEGDSFFAKWTAPEFIKTRGEVLLYLVSVVISVFMIVSSSLEGNYMVTTTFFLLTVVVIFFIFRKPRNIECEINFDGISVNRRLYRYEHIKSFEIFFGDGFNILKFQLRNDFLPVKEIEIAEQDPYYIRAILERFLPEENQKESLIAYEKKSDFDDNISEEELDQYEKEKAENRK